jgi:hypothetical protein
MEPQIGSAGTLCNGHAALSLGSTTQSLRLREYPLLAATAEEPKGTKCWQIKTQISP